MFGWFLRFLTDTYVQKRYVSAGKLFGDAASFYSNMDPGERFEGMRSQWAKWEREYARRGYRTISLKEFAAYGSRNVPLTTRVGEKRETLEKMVLHAQIF